MSEIRLCEGHGYYSIQKVNTGETILVQTDWDYCSLAQSFGWSLRAVQHDPIDSDPCEHSSTDGTVICKECSMPVSIFIARAQNWLDEHIGATADDPGYFPPTMTREILDAFCQ